MSTQPPTDAATGLSRRGLLRAATLAATAATGLAGGVAYADGHSSGPGVQVLADAVAQHRPEFPTLRRRTTRVLWRAETAEKVLALTFDDGPGDPFTREYLDVLAAEKVRATFNLVGGSAAAHLDLVRRELRAGHELGNHTWTHVDLGAADEPTTRRELERTDALIARLTGRRPTILRPPYGHVSGQLLRVAGEMGYDLALWSLELRELALDAQQNAAYVLEELQPGTVLLAHDARGAQRRVGVAALPAIIRGAKARGYTFVTTSELLALDQAAR